MRKLVLLLVITMATITNGLASHLVGGSISYKYLRKSGNDFVYEVTIKMYRDCDTTSSRPQPTPFDAILRLGIFHNNSAKTLYETKNFSLKSETRINPYNVNKACKFNPDVCVMEGIYRDEIVLPPSIVGYHLSYIRCCRNNLVNLEKYAGQTYYSFIPPTKFQNSAPYFSGMPVPFVCIGDTANLLYSAIDPDGDSLVYQLVDPYSGADSAFPNPFPGSTMDWPIPKVTFKTAYKYDSPFGPTGMAEIDSVTGLIKVSSFIKGNFAMAVEVREFRNGQLIGATRRDVQVVFLDCPPNPLPKLVSTGNGTSTTFSIMAGDTLNFPIIFKDPDSMSVVVEGDIFGPGGDIQPNYATLTKDWGEDKIQPVFNWNTNCHHARKQPYIFTLRVLDHGCPPKVQNINFTIYVNEFKGVGSLTGKDTFCTNTGPALFKANREARNSFLKWLPFSGGKYLSSDTSTTMSVGKLMPGTWDLKVLETSKNNCPGDTFTRKITIFSPPINNPGVDKVICGGDSVILGPASPITGVKYTWHDSLYLTRGNIPNPSFFKLNISGSPRIYVINLSQEINGCIMRDSVKVRVNPKPQITAVDGSIKPCFEEENTYKVTTYPGSTYYWEVSGGIILSGQGTGEINIFWEDTESPYLKVIEKNSYGCLADTFTLPVFVVRAGSDSITGTSVVCPNSSNIRYSVNPTPGSTYEWIVKNGNASGPLTGSEIYVNWGEKGAGMVEVVETTVEGCVGDTLHFPVKISYRLKTPPITGLSQVCEFTTGNSYEVYETNGSIYYWSIFGGSFSSADKKSQIMADWGAEGNGNISVVEYSYDSVNNLPCIGDTVRLEVTINPKPNTSPIIGENNYCQGEIGDYFVIGKEGSYFNWTINEDISFNGQGNDSISVHWKSAGKYKLQVKEITKAGCENGIRDMNIDIFKTPVTKGIFGPDTFCFSGSGTVEYEVNGFSTSSFSWTVEGGDKVLDFSGNKVEVLWTGYPEGIIRVQEVSDKNCKGPELEKKVLLDASELEVNYVTTKEQNEKDVYIEWEVKKGKYFTNDFLLYRKRNDFPIKRELAKLSWPVNYFDDISLFTDDYFYKYQVVSRNICGDIISSKQHNTIKLDGKKQGEIDLSLTWNHYKGWGAERGQYIVYRKKPNAGYEEVQRLAPTDSIYTFTTGMEGYNQCFRIMATKSDNPEVYSWSNDRCFIFEPKIFVPNAFSPGTNGINDYFVIPAYNIRIFNLQIYNRWGERVFYSTDPANSWDGNHKGKPCPPGNYLIMLKYYGESEIPVEYKGTITLLR